MESEALFNAVQELQMGTIASCSLMTESTSSPGELWHHANASLWGGSDSRLQKMLMKGASRTSISHLSTSS